MTRRLLTTILVPLFLAACGVAVEKSSLPQTSAPGIIPEKKTAAAPQPAQTDDVDADGATRADEAVDVASLAPSVTGSIDGLTEMIETEAEAEEKAAEDTAAQPSAQTRVPGSEAVAEDKASLAGNSGIVRQGKHWHAMGGGNLPSQHHRIGEQGADHDIRLGNHGRARGNTGAFLYRIKYQKLELVVAK